MYFELDGEDHVVACDKWDRVEDNINPIGRLYYSASTTMCCANGTHVLGAQANMWSEYLRTPADVEFKLFPRLFALAEVAWSPAESRDWMSFTRRLPAAFAALAVYCLRATWRAGQEARAKEARANRTLLIVAAIGLLGSFLGIGWPVL